MQNSSGLVLNEWAGKTILLVEDEALIALAEQKMLERHGYHVIIADNGEKAVELALNTPEINLVLMDINLGPGIDGTAAAEQILDRRNLPLVFLSSHTDPDVVDRTERITSYGYIVKNSGETVLTASIRMAFRLFESRKIAGDTFEYSINGLCVHRAIFDETGEPHDFSYVRVNEAYEGHTGLSAAEVDGKTIREIYPNNETAEVIKLYADVLHSGNPTRRELFFEPTQRWFELSVFPTRKDELSVVIQDITERKEGEAALVAEREWLSVTLRSVGDAVIATDVEGAVTFLNSVAEQLTGWSQDAARGRPLTEVFHVVNATTREVCRNPVETVLREGGVVGLANDTLLISSDGSTYQIADSAAEIRSAEGFLYGVVLVFRDVTRQYTVDATLKESEADMRRAQKMASLGSWRFDLTAKTVMASQQTREIYCLEDGPLSIDDVQKIPLATYRAELDEALRALINEGTPYDIEFEIARASDGAHRHIHSIAEYDSTQNIVIGTIQDITARKRVEEALRHERTTFATIMEISPVGITTVDAAGNITYANAAAEQILGLTRNQITSRRYDAPLWDATTLAGEPFPEEMMPFSIVKATNEPVHDVRHGMTRPDGKRIFLSVNGSPMRNGAGEFAGMVASIEDITERVQAERAL